LGLTVTSKTSGCASNGASDAVGNTTGEVVDLALGFLALACGILLLTFMLQWLFDLSTCVAKNSKNGMRVLYYIPRSRWDFRPSPFRCQWSGSMIPLDGSEIWLVNENTLLVMIETYGIILGYGTAAWSGVACEAAAEVRGVILNSSLVLLVLALLLVRIAASDVAEKSLGSARGGVDVGLEGGGILVRHSGDVGVCLVLWFLKM
jgi:hypothetical protein